MSRRTFLFAPLIFSLLILGLAPVGASAGDCDNFPGGFCPPFGDHRRPPSLGGEWWNIKSGFTHDLVLDAPLELGLRDLRPRPGRHRVTLQPNLNGKSQQFRLRLINGQYQIQVRSTGLCLEGGNQPDGMAIVRQSDCDTPSNAQTWKIEPHPKGNFRIRAGQGRPTGRKGCLDAAFASRTVPPRGTYLQEFPCHDGENQAWAFVDASPAPPSTETGSRRPGRPA
ncbi:RICIN domain-containing protein [Streptomyces sp. ID38640]|nr:RICIN domain-containing protein [Streptomyces sp. ID38640]